MDSWHTLVNKINFCDTFVMSLTFMKAVDAIHVSRPSHAIRNLMFVGMQKYSKVLSLKIKTRAMRSNSWFYPCESPITIFEYPYSQWSLKSCDGWLTWTCASAYIKLQSIIFERKNTIKNALAFKMLRHVLWLLCLVLYIHQRKGIWHGFMSDIVGVSRG